MRASAVDAPRSARRDLRRALSVVRLVLDHGIRDRRLSTNVARLIPLPRGKTNREPHSLRADQLGRLADAMPELGRPVVLYLGLAGCRFSEMAALSVDDVILHVRRVAEPPVQEPPTCAVRYTVHGDWPTGFTSQIWIRNIGTDPVDGWDLEWDMPAGQSVAHHWGSTITTADTTVTATNLSWNAGIPPGQEITMGFNGAKPAGEGGRCPDVVQAERGRMRVAGRVKARALAVGCVGALGACANDETGGRMRAVDDTGRRPSPIEDGWMVALPAADATWELLDAYPEDGHVEPNAKGQEADVRPAGGVWQPLGTGGRFDLPVTPGEWAVCYLPDRDDGWPHDVAGCNVLQLEEGSGIDASWGEGGFWAEVD